METNCENCRDLAHELQETKRALWDAQRDMRACREMFAEANRLRGAAEAAAATMAEALEAALPLLHWADIHGSRCPEVVAIAEAALGTARGEPDAAGAGGGE